MLRHRSPFVGLPRTARQIPPAAIDDDDACGDVRFRTRPDVLDGFCTRLCEDNGMLFDTMEHAIPTRQVSALVIHIHREVRVGVEACSPPSSLDLILFLQ